MQEQRIETAHQNSDSRLWRITTGLHNKTEKTDRIKEEISKINKVGVDCFDAKLKKLID